jgi:hypothetical protein
MGQAANSHRRASLDEKKRRAAGRSTEAKSLNPLRDEALDPPAKDKTGGAFGRSAKINPGGGNATRQKARIAGTGRSTKPARKRG